jgi:mxaC protein
MALDFDLAQPAWLLLLPLAALPLLRRRSDTLVFPAIAWLPPDRAGRLLGLLWRGFAVLAMASAVVGLAGPGRSGGEVQRTGRGAEVLILMDRSSSMDTNVIPKEVKSGGQFNASMPTKSEVVRGLLSRFVAKRADDRFAFMAFSTSPMRIVPFTDDHAMVQAGLAATGVGRGLPDTLMGKALLAAIDEFTGRRYSGSRIILVVSDGGAELDEPTRERIRAGLARERIGLYWIYIRSSPNSPDLSGAGGAGSGTYDSVEEMALHNFFRSLATPYKLYQTDDASMMAAAMAEIDSQQNFPLSTTRRVPRLDHAGAFFLAALLCCAGLLACRALQLQSWRIDRSKA